MEILRWMEEECYKRGGFEGFGKLASSLLLAFRSAPTFLSVSPGPP